MSGGFVPADGSSEEDQMKLLLAIDNSEYSAEAVRGSRNATMAAKSDRASHLGRGAYSSASCRIVV